MKVLLHVAPWLGALVAAGATLSSPAVGRAQSCETGADCPDGYRCRQESYESCYSYDECGPDGACSQTEQVCTTSEYGYCTYATCESDGDCPDTARCQAQSNWVCDANGVGGPVSGIAGAGSVCPPGEMCAPSECHEEPGESLCIPRYSLPCEVAEDCGGGFDCIESSYWECDGAAAAGASGGTAGAGGGEMLPPPPTDPGEPLPPDGSSMGSCHEVPSDEHYCQLQDLPCESDDECPSGLDCIEQYVWLPCSGGGAAGAGGAPSAVPMPMAGPGGDDGMAADGTGDFSCPDPELQRRCMPAEWGGGYPMTAPPGTSSGPSMGTGGASGGGTSDEPSDDDGDPDQPSDSTSNESGAAGSGGTSDSGGADMEATSVGSGEVGDDDVEEPGAAPGLCAAGGPINADPSTWLLLGMTALVLRRRARH